MGEPAKTPEVIIPTLEGVDRDGALLEALDAAVGRTRAEFLRRAAMGSAALLGAVGPDKARNAGTKAR